MNLTNVRKKIKNIVKEEWSVERMRSLHLNDLDVETIVMTLADYENKMSVKEIVLIGYQGLPLFITIKRENVPLLKEWLLEWFTRKEQYEMCHQVNILKY